MLSPEKPLCKKEKPTVRDNDYWSGGSYLSGPATRLPQVTSGDPITVELKYGLFTPVLGSVELFTVYDINEPMFNPAARSESYAIDSVYQDGRLTFTMDPEDADHQVAVATAVWYGILGKREVNYVFLFSAAE